VFVDHHDLPRWEPPMTGEPEPRHFRTLFLSDVHLGTRGAQAEMLLDFLKYHDAETLYLVGDIVDGWRLRKSWYWPQSHNDVIQKLLRKGRKGARIIYIPGNHDEFLRDYAGSHFGVVEIKENDIHVTADGRRLLIMHGDEFDVVVRRLPWLAHVGDVAYTIALGLNTIFNRVRRKVGIPYWSLSAWAKAKVKSAVNFIGSFEETLSGEARRRQVDGVVCGHIHTAALHSEFGIQYINTGDWVESCTAVVEHHDGRLELITWRRTPIKASVEEPADQEAPAAA
jgi:UDP-2,3-diacylglucosamine pyrophosphatase LpxH